MNSKNSSLKEKIKKGLFETYYAPKIKNETSSFEFVFGNNKDMNIQNSFNNAFSDFFNFGNKGSFNFNSSFNEKKAINKEATNNNQSFTFSKNSSNANKIQENQNNPSASQKISNSTLTKSSEYIKAHEEYFNDEKSESDKGALNANNKTANDKLLNTNSSLKIMYKGSIINKESNSLDNNLHLMKNGSSFKERIISKSDLTNVENSIKESSNNLLYNSTVSKQDFILNSYNNSFSQQKGLKLTEPLNLTNSDVFYNNLLMKNKKSDSNIKKVDSSVKEEFNNIFRKTDSDIKVPPPLTGDSNASKASNYKFVQKLIEILSNNSLKRIVKWSEDGNNIEILNQREFTDKVLPLYFKHNNYSNFIRQLNMYHFKKVKNQDSKDNAISYSNDFFKRNSTHLIGEIHRKQQYGGCGSSYIDKEDKIANNEHFTNKLNTLFNKIFELEEKIKQLNNVNDTVISNNMNFIEDIKDKSYYIGVLENVIFYIVNNFLSNSNNNITINNSYSNFENLNENNFKAIAPGDQSELLGKINFDGQSKSNSSFLNSNKNFEEIKQFKSEYKNEKIIAVLEKESNVLECTCGCYKSEIGRKNSDNSIITCNSNMIANNKENEIKKSIIIIKEELPDDMKSYNSKKVNNVNVNYEYCDEGISSLGSRNIEKSKDFFSNNKSHKQDEKELFQNFPDGDSRKKYVDLIMKLNKEKYELEKQIIEKKNKQFCKKCFVNELKNRITNNIYSDQELTTEINFDKKFETPQITDKRITDNNPEGAFKHLLNRFKEYTSKKNINLINNASFTKKLRQLTKNEINYKDTPDFNFYGGEKEKLNLKENVSPQRVSNSNNFTKFNKKVVEKESTIDYFSNLENCLSDNKLGINSNLELPNKLSGRKRNKK